MTRLLWVLMLMLAVAPSAAQTVDLDQIAARQLPATKAPGMAWANVRGDTIAAGAKGVLRKGDQKPVTANTLFPIGSVTKSFTALAILQLSEDEKLTVDDPLSAHLPLFADRAAGRITLRQLMSHTSGYSTVQGNVGHQDGPNGDIDEIARIAAMEPASGPGRQFQYSNANYILLGAVIEKVSGETYDQYVTRNILAPLGIANMAGRERVTAHRPWFGGKSILAEGGHADGISAAGGLMLSANDLATFVAMMLNGKDDLLSAESKASMMRPASAASPHYGLGWFIDDDAGTVYHSGLVPGAEALVMMHPEDRKGAVVLVNANSGIGIAFNYNLSTAITAAAFGRDPPTPVADWGMKATYFTIMLLPILFFASILWAITHRPALVAKRSNRAGQFSLWFPVLTTSAMAVVILLVVPPLFGGSMATLRLFQPDFALAMTAAAIFGPAWSLLRLGLAYTGKNVAA